LIIIIVIFLKISFGNYNYMVINFPIGILNINYCKGKSNVGLNGNLHGTTYKRIERIQGQEPKNR
jgi:hypothetical protein